MSQYKETTEEKKLCSKNHNNFEAKIKYTKWYGAPKVKKMVYAKIYCDLHYLII